MGMKFENNKANTKGKWKTKTELSNNDKKNENPGSLKIDGRIVVESKGIFHVLGEYFSAIGKSVSEISYNDCIKIAEPFKDDRGLGLNINIAETNLEEMKQIIELMKLNLPGSNYLNLQTFKLLIVYLLPCLVYLNNLSLKKAEFPSRLNEGMAFCLHKKVQRQIPRTGDRFRYCLLF